MNKTIGSLIIVFVIFCLLPSICFTMEAKVFDGSIDFLNKNLNFFFDFKERGSIDVKGNIDKDNQYFVSAFLKHFKFGKADILTNFQAKGVITDLKSAKKVIKGKAWTERSLLNFKPLKEFQAEYELTQDKLKINSLSWADLSLRGQIIFKPSWNADLILFINGMDVNSLADLLGFDNSGIELGGFVTGKVIIKGTVDKLAIEGKLLVSDGMVSDIRFNSARINVEGTWPVLRFVNSEINEVAGVVYDLDGQFNLAELSNFYCPDHKVIVKSANNAMRFQEWVIRRRSDMLGKDVVEAEYSLKKNQALKMRIKSEEETLAWQKSLRF